MEVGKKLVREEIVTRDKSAMSLGSGMVEVFATPMMILLMESTSAACVAPELEEGCATVGTQINVSHSAATPIGMKVRCESELTGVDGRKLTFHVAAYDECGLIGEGTHERFIIHVEKFTARANDKLKK